MSESFKHSTDTRYQEQIGRLVTTTCTKGLDTMMYHGEKHGHSTNVGRHRYENMDSRQRAPEYLETAAEQDMCPGRTRKYAREI